MLGLERLQALVIGTLDTDSLRNRLAVAAVPVTDADCRNCSDPCDDGHDPYPSRFSVDMESEMLGSVKPYRRQVVISTGKTDWDKEIAETRGSIASLLSDARNRLPIAEPTRATPTSKAAQTLAGVFQSSESKKISILNGSHNTMSDDVDQETVLIFPDYTLVSDVPHTKDGARALWEAAVDPTAERGSAMLEKTPFKTWVLPYSCVILLCSHKTRDNRCAIAAPKLEQAFMHSLQENGWAADTQLDCHCLMGRPLEELQLTPDEARKHIEKELKSSADEKRALILKTSHVGGHKYAGNCIIHTPQGSSIWYGRVSTHEVESIVVNTIIHGLVLPPLLRGGLNISRPGCKTLNDW